MKIAHNTSLGACRSKRAWIAIAVETLHRIVNYSFFSTQSLFICWCRLFFCKTGFLAYLTIQLVCIPTTAWSCQGWIWGTPLYFNSRRNLLLFNLNHFSFITIWKNVYFYPSCYFFTFRIFKEETHVCQESTGCKTKKLYKMWQIRLLLAQWNLVTFLDVKFCSCCLCNMCLLNVFINLSSLKIHI